MTRARRILRAGRLHRVGLRLSAALLLAFAPVAAHASSEHGESGSMTWEILNMALLLGVLFYVTRKPVSAYLADRRSGIASGLEHAEKLLIGAQARLAEWTRRELGLSEESAEIERAALDAAKREGESLIDGARASAERIGASATAAIDSETRRARGRLRDEATDLALARARELLSAELGDADQARLVDEFIERVARGEAA